MMKILAGSRERKGISLRRDGSSYRGIILSPSGGDIEYTRLASPGALEENNVLINLSDKEMRYEVISSEGRDSPGTGTLLLEEFRKKISHEELYTFSIERIGRGRYIAACILKEFMEDLREGCSLENLIIYPDSLGVYNYWRSVTGRRGAASAVLVHMELEISRLFFIEDNSLIRVQSIDMGFNEFRSLPDLGFLQEGTQGELSSRGLKVILRWMRELKHLIAGEGRGSADTRIYLMGYENKIPSLGRVFQSYSGIEVVEMEKPGERYEDTGALGNLYASLSYRRPWWTMPAGWRKQMRKVKTVRLNPCTWRI